MQTRVVALGKIRPPLAVQSASKGHQVMAPTSTPESQTRSIGG